MSEPLEDLKQIFRDIHTDLIWTPAVAKILSDLKVIIESLEERDRARVEVVATLRGIATDVMVVGGTGSMVPLRQVITKLANRLDSPERLIKAAANLIDVAAKIEKEREAVRTICNQMDISVQQAEDNRRGTGHLGWELAIKSWSNRLREIVK